jgi:hypothetical protein
MVSIIILIMITNITCGLASVFPVRRMRRHGLGCPQHPPPAPGGVLRDRPDFPVPADLAAGDGPAVHD